MQAPTAVIVANKSGALMIHGVLPLLLLFLLPRVGAVAEGVCCAEIQSGERLDVSWRGVSA